MAQGKLKVKTKVPNAKGPAKKKNKGLAIQRRGNAPIQPKKKLLESSKFNKTVTKEINKALEQELRERALEGKVSLGKKKKPQDEKTT